MTTRTPAWAAPVARQSSWICPTRLHAVVGSCALFTVYLLSIVLWKRGHEILAWEGGAIPVSYTDQQWTPYKPIESQHAEDPEDKTCAPLVDAIDDKSVDG